MNVIFSCRCCCSLPPSLSFSFSVPANCCYGIVYVITGPRGVTKSFSLFILFVFLILMVSPLPPAQSVNLSPEVYLKLIPGKCKKEGKNLFNFPGNRQRIGCQKCKAFHLHWLIDRTPRKKDKNTLEIKSGPSWERSDKGNTNATRCAVRFDWISCNMFAHLGQHKDQGNISPGWVKFE